jgi:hypothetical protein
VTTIGFIGGLGKRLLQAAAQRVAAINEGSAQKQLPPGIQPDKLDAALARLRAERPPADAPQGFDMSD